jgi:hypothetical protein
VGSRPTHARTQNFAGKENGLVASTTNITRAVKSRLPLLKTCIGGSVSRRRLTRHFAILCELLQHSEGNNARLLKVFPKGFALDATHRPHITMIQRFVRTADLDRVYEASGQVLSCANVTAMKLEAFKYYYLPTKDIGVAGIVAKATPELFKVQADLIAAVASFTVETGDSAAFVTAPYNPVIDTLLIGYVATFVPKASGEYFNPHVTTGVAPREYLDQMRRTV